MDTRRSIKGVLKSQVFSYRSITRYPVSDLIQCTLIEHHCGQYKGFFLFLVDFKELWQTFRCVLSAGRYGS